MLTIFQVVGRLVLSFILGALIGVERERLARGAGLKTFSLVSLATCFFVILSLQIQPTGFSGNLSFDPSRVLASIVLGIGFLGSGVILKQEAGVIGVTTAAGLWVASAIGAGVGFGFYLETIILDFLTVIILYFGGILEKRYLKK